MVIKLKRGLKANLPEHAQLGEPLVTLDTGELFIGQGAGKPLRQIAGYQAPPAGIPEDDLAQSVKDALGAAREVEGVKEATNLLGERLNSVDASFVEIKGKVTSLELSTEVARTEREGLRDRVSAVEGALGSVKTTQVTKLGVIASPASPRFIDIKLSPSPEFNRPPIEVLKFEAGETIIRTVCSFDNTDETDFLENEAVVFDGTMRLLSRTQIQLENEGEVGTGVMRRGKIPVRLFKKITALEVL